MKAFLPLVRSGRHRYPSQSVEEFYGSSEFGWYREGFVPRPDGWDGLFLLPCPKKIKKRKEKIFK